MVKFFKFLIPSILLVFLVANIAAKWETVLVNFSNFNFPPLLVSFLFLMLVYPEGAFCWYLVLRKMGFKIDIKKTLWTWIVANTSRYIPGMIWQYVGRVKLAQRVLGISPGKIFQSILLEIFLILTAGVFTAAFAIPLIKEQIAGGFWIFLLPIPILILHPSISEKLIGVLAKFAKRKFASNYKSVGFRDTLLTFPWYVSNFLINGTALFFLVSAFYQTFDFVYILVFSGIYAFSWVFGYISVFAPAGLGVAEVSLAYLLSFKIPFALASTIALSYRFFLTVAELLVFLIFLRLRRSKDGK